MKKLFAIACMMLMSTAMFAQDIKMAVGVNANYGMHKDYKNFGIGAKIQCDLMEGIRGEASGNYFFKKDNLSMWDVNLNAHYVYAVSENINVYPIVGLTMMGYKMDFEGATGYTFGTFEEFAKSTGVSSSQLATLKQYAPDSYKELEAEYEALKNDVEDSESETKIGFNVGAGVEYFLTPNLKINAEVKYQYVKDMDRPVISAGIAYCF